MAHGRDELRLVLARLRELPALLLDLAEQAGILDGQHRLGGEGLEQVDGARAKLAWRLAAHDQRADHLAGAHERYQQPRQIASAQDGVIDRRRRQSAQISHLIGLVGFGQLADSLGNFGMHVADRGDQFLAHAVGRAQLELLPLI